MSFEIESSYVRLRKWRCWRFSLRAILLLVLAVAIAMYAWQSLRTREGSAAAADDAPIRNLPPQATDIHYHIPAVFGPVTAFDFRIDEAGFLKWARENEWLVTEVRSEGFWTYRYAPRSAFTFEQLEIMDGYSFERRVSRDAGLEVAYDRRLQRAYYYAHSR